MSKKTQSNQTSPDRDNQDEVRARDPKTDYEQQASNKNADRDTATKNQSDVKQRQQQKDRTGEHDRDSDFNQHGSVQGEYRKEEGESKDVGRRDPKGYPQGDYQGGNQGSGGKPKQD